MLSPGGSHCRQATTNKTKATNIVLQVRIFLRFEFAHSGHPKLRAKLRIQKTRNWIARLFVQINKSVIVNINCVKSIQAEFSGNYRIKLKNRKESLTISRKYFKEFKDRI